MRSSLFRSGSVAALIGLALVARAACFAQVPATIAEQMTTQERIERSKWWPTSGRAARAEYLGPQACQECHYALVKSQSQHSMAKASVPASNSDILRQHAGQSFRLGAYDYNIAQGPNGTFRYSVTDSVKNLSGPFSWAFGAGKVGQSYLSEENGSFHEIRFSYFNTLHAFDVTPNQSPQSATSIDKATGRVVASGEAQRCFGCHTTASKSRDEFDPANAIPGVSCESCHGPGSKHVAAMKAGNLDSGLAAIVNPRELTPVGLVDFCGACHTSWWDAKRIAATGVANVRFHPYRLESSRCWGNGDARLTCLACHDPHRPLVRDAAAYDGRCLSCHSTSTGVKTTAATSPKTCPVSNQNCVTCHMPKYEVPDMHYKYTDHRIRVVKGGESFPD